MLKIYIKKTFYTFDTCHKNNEQFSSTLNKNSNFSNTNFYQEFYLFLSKEKQISLENLFII